jgi:rare lipoprotein A (peptidoglycan hydrolase)
MVRSANNRPKTAIPIAAQAICHLRRLTLHMTGWRLVVGAITVLFVVGWLTPRATAGQAGPRSFSGLAAYYSQSGKVASGGQFDPTAMTAAHPTLPFGTRVRVTDPKSGRSVIVIINDRGPYGRGRVIDVSLAAARALGMIGRGVIYVRADICDAVTDCAQ